MWCASIIGYVRSTVECRYNTYNTNIVKHYINNTYNTNIVKHYINNYKNWARILIRCWIHKRHPIPSPNGHAMRCLLWIFVRKLATFIMAPHCIMPMAHTLLCFVVVWYQFIYPYPSGLLHWHWSSHTNKSSVGSSAHVSNLRTCYRHA